MAAQTETPTTSDHDWNVVIDNLARSSIRQLTDSEQKSVRTALQAISREGLVRRTHPAIRKLRKPHDTYGIRLRGAPDVEIFARVSEDRTIRVIDVLRPSMLRNIVHAS